MQTQKTCGKQKKNLVEKNLQNNKTKQNKTKPTAKQKIAKKNTTRPFPEKLAKNLNKTSLKL